MTEHERDEFETIWCQAAELYGRAPADGALDMAYEALRDYGIHAIRRALTAHIRDPDSGRFAPKPADVIRHIDGDTESRALNAWSQVRAAIRRIGNYDSVVFDDPATMAIIEAMGGWIELCDSTAHELKFKQHEFVKRYIAFARRPPANYPGHLAGIIERHNRGHFDAHVPAPRAIGDESACRRIANTGEQRRIGTTRLHEAIAHTQH